MQTLITKEALFKMIDDDPTLFTDLLKPRSERSLAIDLILPLDIGAHPRWPHLVHYRRGKAIYVDPHKFLFRIDPDGPSDCTWIVPGTAP